MYILRIGDKLADDSIVVRDEDRLCYQVLSTSKGVTGLRTINKVLLEEWVDAVRQHPNYSSSELRDLLSGKTEIDKFEYGYAATLKKMADMVLGNVGVVRPRPDYSADFCRWFAENRGKGKDTTAKKYISYFKTLTDTYQEPTNSYWHGLYRVMYSVDAEKDVIEIGGLAEFERIYGSIVTALEEKVKGVRMTDEGFQRAIDWFWKPEVKSHTCVTSALNAYSDFLKWRETQQPQETKPEELPPNVDRLTIALKGFAERRGTESPGGWSNYDEWTKGVREEFSQVGESLLSKPGFNYVVYLRKYSISWQVVNTKFAPHTDAEKHAVLKFLHEQKEAPKLVSWYIDDANRIEVGGKRVDGMSAKTLLYFMSELHPGEFAPWTEPTYEGLSFLGLHNGPIPKNLTVDTYEDCKAKQHQIIARMKELAIGKATDDTTDPDYRTVNEFLWWLGQDDNKNLIKEKVMSKQLKPVNSKEKIKNGTRKLEDAFKDDEMLKRLAAALRTKPFAILAGHSGTGKSRLVRRLAYMTCNNELLVAEGAGKAAPGNYCMVQVKPNWHDSTDLLGYYSEMDGRHFVNTPFVQFICKAYAYPDTPFFVCLDEMNLAPVEQYFAEYLSAVESMVEKDGVWVTDPLVEVDKTDEKDAGGREKIDVAILEQIMKGAASTEAAEWIQKHGLTIPKNLFVVGTVNVDETTSQFPRKVLDRAMTLLMNEVRFADMAKSKSPSEEELLDETGLKFFLERDGRKVGERESKLLDGINAPLSNTPFMVAYRFGNEYALYEAALAKLDGVDLASADEAKQDEIARRALDHVVMMKLLPRIHGEKVEVKNIFGGYDRKKEGGGTEHVDGLKNKLLPNGLSVAMMDKILARDDEYLTFWP